MSEARPRNWLKISCIGCVGAPCLMLLLTFGFVKCQVGKIGNTLEPELAKLRGMGIPTEPDQLKPNPPVPDNENAAPLYTEIFKEQAEFGKKNRLDVRYLNEYTGAAADNAAYAQASKRYDSIFRKIDRISEFKQIDFKHDYNKGFDLMFPEFTEIKGISKVLSPRTRFQVGRGEFDAALKNIETQLTIVDHLSEEPLLIGALVAIALQSIAYANTEFFLGAIKDNQPMLAKTEAVLLRHQKLPNMRQALVGELVLGRLAIRSIKSWNDLTMISDSGEPSALQRSLDRVTMNDPAFRKMFEAKQVQTWREFFESAPKGPREYAGYDKAMEALDKKLEADQSLENRVNQLLFPLFSQAGKAMLRCQAQQRLELIAVKLLRMRPTGLPKDLKQFGDLAIDSSTGKPMGYVRKGRGFKVWIAGHDGVDNGGKPFVSGMSSRAGTDQVLGFDIGLPGPVIKPVGISGMPAGALHPASAAPGCPNGPWRPLASSTRRRPLPSCR